jgi:hypothetical protein
LQSILVETDSTQDAGFDRLFARRVDHVLMGGRMLEATDVANAVLFLASPLSDLFGPNAAGGRRRCRAEKCCLLEAHAQEGEIPAGAGW